MLDTNICIYLIKERSQSLVDRFLTLPVGEVAISAVTLAELEYGASKSMKPERNRATLQLFVSPLVVAAFDNYAAEQYGKLRTSLERKGTPIGGMDMLIAAHALSLKLTLVTNNTREFARVEGLHIENWV